MVSDTVLLIKKRRDMDQAIKDGIFALSGGRRSILIKGEGSEISTAVEVGLILKNRMYPGVEISNIHLGSRPFYNRGRNRKRRNKNNNKFKKEIVSQIEIKISKKDI